MIPVLPDEEYNFVKTWFDNRRYGSLSRNNPIQSKLCVNIVEESYIKRDIDLDHSLFQKISSISNTSKEEDIISREWNSSNVFDKILTGILNNKSNENENIPIKLFSVQECIDKMNFNNLEFTENTLSSVNTNKTFSNTVNTENINKSQTSELKNNQFKTAKDQFVKDGGSVKNFNTKSVETITGSVKITKQGNGEDGCQESKQYEQHLIDKIEAEIIHKGQEVRFDDIAGLEFAKKCVNELICWPMSRPDLFQGIRSLPRGLLLFGPPGTGKTLIGKAVSFQVGATFFSISASSLTSKWIGEGEKTVRTLFAVASMRQPSVIFIDEVDSLLSQRSSDENEASRRMKTEFLIQIDGAGTNSNDRVVLIGATNRPDELDEAARRRFVKRIYIPLPDLVGRKQLFLTLLKDTIHDLDNDDIDTLVEQTDGFSGADIDSLCTEAAMGPVRDIVNKSNSNLKNVKASDVPPISTAHFLSALSCVSPSVSISDLKKYLEWNDKYGSYKKI